jgi:hypothetical protein
MVFHKAFFHFKDFFRKKTGIDWDQRLECTKMPAEFFVYTPPILGRPVGYVCEGYQRPELRIRELTEGESGDSERESGSAEEGEEEEGVVYDTDSEAEYDDSEEDGGSGTITSRSEGSRAEFEEGSESFLTKSSSSRVESEDEEVSSNFYYGAGGSFGSRFSRSFAVTPDSSFLGSFDSGLDVSFGGITSARRSGESEESGGTEQTQTRGSDGLREVLKEVVEARTPPGLIYLSD